MSYKKILNIFVSEVYFLLFIYILAIKPPLLAFSNGLKTEEQEYKKQMALIKSTRDALKPGQINNISEYEKFVEEIQRKWKDGKKELYAYLMLEICKPISSGYFKDNRSSDVAREYALSALKDANEIPVELELQLTGHIITMMYSSNAPKGEDFASHRKKDTEIRFHAWRRLIDSIDPNWDPNDVPFINVPLPKGAIGVSGMSPEDIKDPKLRAEYEAAIEKNNQKAERYSKQDGLRNWMKRYPRIAERYIIELYSLPPYNNEELQNYLDRYISDQETRERIMTTVKNNIEKVEKEKPK